MAHFSMKSRGRKTNRMMIARRVNWEKNQKALSLTSNLVTTLTQTKSFDGEYDTAYHLNYISSLSYFVEGRSQ